jgi:hypothetical protein
MKHNRKDLPAIWVRLGWICYGSIHPISIPESCNLVLSIKELHSTE